MLAARNELVDNVRVDDVDLIGKDAHQQAAQLRPVQLTIAIQVEFPVIRADVVRYAWPSNRQTAHVIRRIRSRRFAVLWGCVSVSEWSEICECEGSVQVRAYRFASLPV